MIKSLLIAAALLADTSMLAIAQDAVPAAKNSSQPIEITAVKSVEWLRNDKKYIARDNVIIKQGTVTIQSDLATADYREAKGSSMQIWQLTAEGNVSILSDGNTATGDKAVYDVDKALSTLTGNNLKITSPEQTVTATDRMEYYTNTRQAKAIGHAKVVRGTDTLSADTITATFKDKNAAATPTPTNTPGGGNLDTLEADGNVVITTPTEVLHGTHGIYHASTNTAEISGKVKIERGQNVLEGDRAEVNLTTNVSKMFGSDKPGGRVRGLFFPGSDQKTGGLPKAGTVAPPAPAAAPVMPAPAPVSMAPSGVPEMFPATDSTTAPISKPVQ